MNAFANENHTFIFLVKENCTVRLEVIPTTGLLPFHSIMSFLCKPFPVICKKLYLCLKKVTCFLPEHLPVLAVCLTVGLVSEMFRSSLN